MAGRKDAAKNVAVETEPKPVAPAPDREALTDKQLAKAVLAGTFRPRAAELRRLAEAVLRKDAPKPSRKKGKAKKPKSGKLVKIPRSKK